MIAAMEALGVGHVYGVPGEETTALMEAIAASELTFVLCRHEQAAAFQASVHGRLRGKPGACLSTLGPGATNLVTGVADAQLDHVPLIAITGQGARHRLGRVSHQMVDLEALLRPITKLSRTLLDADAIPAAVAEAVRMATEEKPGAVHLCLPEDAAEIETRAPLVAVPETRGLIASDAAIAESAARLREAEHPVILAGAGVIRAGAAEAVKRFADATGIPVATSFMGKGILPDDHPLTLFSIGQPENDHTDAAFEAADLIFAVGFDPIEYPPAKLTQDGAIPVIAFEPGAPVADAGWQLAAHVGGDLEHSLSALGRALDGAQWARPEAFDTAQARMWDALDRPVTEDGAERFAPQDICATISDKLRPEDTVLSGVGAA